MKQGIEITRTYDYRDQPIIRITKRRGKLTLEEIGELLRYEDRNKWCGQYTLILNCSENTLGGNGLYFDEPQPGDAVDLYPLEELSDCPVCGKLLPPFIYCPNCGTSWKAPEESVETLIAAMRTELAHMLESSERPTSRAAWYYSFLGSVDMARQLGLITEARRVEIYAEVKPLQPTASREATDQRREEDPHDKD